MEDDWLIEEIMTMAVPQVAGGLSLSDWATGLPGSTGTLTSSPTHYPPAFALLKGLEAFQARLTHFRCILGRASPGAQSLVAALGDADRGANGLIFEYSNSLRGGTLTSAEEEQEEPVAPFPSMHIGFDKSIARRHALIEWDFEEQEFQIRCLSRAGLTVNGTISLQVDDAPLTLHHRSVVQIGNRIFFFLLPSNSGSNVSADINPLMHSQNVANALLHSAKYRSFINKCAARAIDEGEDEGDADKEKAQSLLDLVDNYEANLLPPQK